MVPVMTKEIKPRRKILPLWDQLPAQNFETVLTVAGKLAGEPILAMFCLDA